MELAKGSMWGLREEPILPCERVVENSVLKFGVRTRNIPRKGPD